MATSQRSLHAVASRVSETWVCGLWSGLVLALVVVLLGAWDAQASWSQTESAPAGVVSTGALRLTADGPPSFELDGGDFDPSAGDICVGDTIRISVPVNVVASGTTMAPALAWSATEAQPAHVTVAPVGLDEVNQALAVSDTPQHHVVQVDVTSTEPGTVSLGQSLTLTSRQSSGWSSSLLLDTTVVFEQCAGQIVTTWDTSVVNGAGPHATVYLQRPSAMIDWGDGTPVEPVPTTTMVHTYAEPGIYTMTITGTFASIRFAHPSPALVSVDRWDEQTETTSMAHAFSQVPNLRSVVKPPSTVTTMASAFMGALANPELIGWDTSGVTDMSNMFNRAANFDGDLSGWDTSGVTSMAGMFSGAVSFDGDLSGWDTSHVKTMAHTFNSAVSFDGDLSGWDTSGVTNMTSMFNAASSFTGDLRRWDVTRISQEPASFRTGAHPSMMSPVWGTSGAVTREARASTETREDAPDPGEPGVRADGTEPLDGLPSPTGEPLSSRGDELCDQEIVVDDVRAATGRRCSDAR